MTEIKEEKGEVIDPSERPPPALNEEKQKKLEKVIAYESTNFQWDKIGLNWGIIVVQTVVALLRGSGTNSIAGISRCETVDWVLFGMLQLFCLIFLLAGIKVAKQDYINKVDCGYEFSPGDFQATSQNLMMLIAIAFVGSMFAAFCGVGPGFIFSPILVMIGLHPIVATATGMYVTMFTTLSASIQVLIFQ